MRVEFAPSINNRNKTVIEELHEDIGMPVNSVQRVLKIEKV